MERLRFIRHTPRATISRTIGNQSTETENTYYTIRYEALPRAITVRDRLMDRLKFIRHTPRATISRTIGNQSTETENTYYTEDKIKKPIKYEALPRAIPVRDRLMDRLKFIRHRATVSHTIGNQ